MGKKARLGLYLEDDVLKKRVKIAAAKRGISTTAYCAQAIKERLVREGEMSGDADAGKRALLARMDKLRDDMGPIGESAAELVREGRRR